MFLTKLTWQAYKCCLARPCGELDRFQLLDPDRQRREIAKLLLAQIRYFGTRADAFPEWREAARAREPEDLWKLWPSLPVMTKASLNTRFDPAEMQRRFGLRGRTNATGGSTGEPTRFFLDTPMLRASRGGDFYTRIKMGWRPGMSTIIVWGSDRDIGRQSKPLYRLAHALYGNRLVPGFEVDDQSIARILAIVRSEAPVAIYGYSSLLEHLAERTLAAGTQPPAGSVAAAWNGGEMLYDHQVQSFKCAFGVPILNRYGGRELSTMAFQEHEGAHLRVLRPWVLVEILDASGNPAAPGEPGRLVVTSTICRGTPFLRYDVGDLGICSEADIDESGVRTIARLEGRHAGAMRLSGGRFVSALYWNHLMKDYPEVNQFQVRLKAEGPISILLVGTGFTSTRADQLRDALRIVWKDQPVDLVWTESIPRSPQGKLMQVIQES
jgi:phenylacetate-CoA ligase